MVCYYDILEVSKDSDESEIKASYRRLALKWHPDKNLDNVHYSTIKFQELQQAYSVLSDPVKKFLYDEGQEDLIIIFSNYNDENVVNEAVIFKPTYSNHNHPSYYRFNFPRKFDLNNPFKYIRWDDLDYLFKMNWFNGYSEKVDGFYTMCRKLFERLSLEHLYRDPEDCGAFGSSTSNYNEVVAPFYRLWCTFEINDKLFPCTCIAVKRNQDILKLVEMIKKVDKRVQKHFDSIPKKICINKPKPNKIKVKKSGKGQSSSGAKPELYNYSGSANDILYNINGDYKYFDDEDDVYI